MKNLKSLIFLIAKQLQGAEQLVLDLKSNKSFTLLELIVTIFVVSVGIVGAFSLITQGFITASINSQRLTAAYLGQEGIELVRNIRDTNWLESDNPSWDEGLTGCSTGCIADYTYSVQLDPILPTYTGQVLNIDTNDFYSYSFGTPTLFKRKITITPDGTDILKVSVLIEWQERGNPRSITVQENLYNWR